MTKDRIRVVSREPLARAVERLGLLDYVRVGRGAKEEAFKMDKPKSDLFESVLAAIYIDSKRISTLRGSLFRIILRLT